MNERIDRIQTRRGRGVYGSYGEADIGFLLAEIDRIMGTLRSAHDEAEFCERAALGDVLYDIEKGRE